LKDAHLHYETPANNRLQNEEMVKIGFDPARAESADSLKSLTAKYLENLAMVSFGAFDEPVGHSRRTRPV
jgi:hypothetical protein